MSSVNCGGMSNQYVLAMYDVRGKQDYIYRRNKLKEIVGASLIIRDCFIDYLFPMAEKVEGKGIYSYRVAKDSATGKYKYRENEEPEEFVVEDVIHKFEAENYIGYVIYDGGGNFFVLYKSLDIYTRVNKLFYTKLMVETGTLKVLTSYVEGIDFADYNGDEKRLRAFHRVAEQKECALYPVNALPIVQVDYSSSMPLTNAVKLPDDNKLKPEKVCRESFAKYMKFNASNLSEKDEIKKLDDLVEKGEDSHVAVIYIDGNSMGAKVEACRKGKKTYEECVNALRQFSASIQRNYIDTPMTKIKSVLTDDEDRKLFRFVVYAGDEITFICNAKYAYKVVKAYFESLNFENNQSSCAGVAIFHSHAPYSEAYRIAEECCESGKTLMKKHGISNACFMDFHYSQGAIGTSLEKIREHEGTEDACTPWLIKGDANAALESVNKNEIEKMEKVLAMLARSNNKTLLQVSKKSQEVYEQEIERIIAHYRGDGREEEKNFLKENKQFIKDNKNLLYRMMMVYDLWFREEAER